MTDETDDLLKKVIEGEPEKSWPGREAPAMENAIYRQMDASQISMLETTSPKVKALITLDKVSGFEIGETGGPEAREPRVVFTSEVVVPFQYILDFLKDVAKTKEIKHLKIYSATDRPLLLEAMHESDGTKTRYYLAPRVENMEEKAEEARAEKQLEEAIKP